MKQFTDEAEVFNLLEKFRAAEFDYSVHHARFLISPENVGFLMFCPEGIRKGTILFLFDNPPAVGQVEQDLLGEVFKFNGDESAEKLRDMATEAVREYVENRSAGHYFFDAH